MKVISDNTAEKITIKTYEESVALTNYAKAGRDIAVILLNRREALEVHSLIGQWIRGELK